MNTFLALSDAGQLTMPRIIFWLLLSLWAIGSIGFPGNTGVVRGSNVVMVILFGILGFYLFGF